MAPAGAPSMATTIETLLELHRLLRELAHTDQQLAQRPTPLEQIFAEHQTLQGEIEGLRTQIRDAEQAHRAAEGEAELAKGKIAHYQEQIQRVTTQREYGALLAEIDAAKALVRARDDEALAALETIENANAALAERTERHTTIDREYQLGASAWEEGKPVLRERAAVLRAHRETLEAALPVAVRRTFERLAARHAGDPMARVERVQRPTGAVYRCSACNYQVRPQVVVELRNRGDLITCECGQQRIYYLDAES